MKPTARDRQGQEAEHPLLQRIKSPHHVEGDRDHEQPNGEVHQVGMNGKAVRQPIGSEFRGDLIDRRLLRAVSKSEEHQINPSRMAATTFTVCRP